MTDTGHDKQGTNKGLFQNMDEQERTFAPQQVPSDERTGAHPDDTVDREAVVGSEGQYAPPVIPAQSTIGSSVNTPVPPTAEPDLLTGREQSERDHTRD